MKNLVKVSRASNLPFRPSTLYKWHHTRRYPEIFIKFAGSLFVDVDKLAQLIERNRGQREVQ